MLKIHANKNTIQIILSSRHPIEFSYPTPTCLPAVTHLLASIVLTHAAYHNTTCPRILQINHLIYITNDRLPTYKFPNRASYRSSTLHRTFYHLATCTHPNHACCSQTTHHSTKFQIKHALPTSRPSTHSYLPYPWIRFAFHSPS